MIVLRTNNKGIQNVTPRSRRNIKEKKLIKSEKVTRGRPPASPKRWEESLRDEKQTRQQEWDELQKSPVVRRRKKGDRRRNSQCSS